MSVILAGGLASPWRAEHDGYVSGTSYATAPDGQVLTTAAVAAADTLYGYLWFNPAPVTVSALLARCATGGAGSAMKAAVWRYANRRAQGVPVLAFNTGVATTATADLTMTVSGVLPAGWLLLASKFTGTLPSMAMVPAGQRTARLHGGTVSNAVQISNAVTLSASDAYANDIAATDLSAVTLTLIASATALPPHIGFTVA